MSYSILIVDDSATTRAIIKRTIQMCGIETHALLEAPDGQKALEIIRAQKPDLVFMDINMPNMNGIDTTRAIRAEPAIAKTRVVIVSSESTASRQSQLRNEGVEGYITKPFTPERIRDVISSVFGVAHAA